MLRRQQGEGGQRVTFMALALSAPTVAAFVVAFLGPLGSALSPLLLASVATLVAAVAVSDTRMARVRSSPGGTPSLG